MRRWAAVAVTAAVAVGASVLWTRRDGRTPAGARPGAPLLAPGSPVAIRVVFEVTDTAGPEPLQSQDVLLVQPPFDIRIEHRDVTHHVVTSGLVVNRQASFRLDAGGVVAPLSGARPPGPLPGMYAEAALAAGVAAGVAERLGDGRFAGEDCHRYAYRDLDSVPLQRPTGTDRVEVCVTADGIGVDEIATLDGRVVRHTRAVTVERSSALADDPFLQESPGTGTLDTVRIAEATDEALAGVAVPTPGGYRMDQRLTIERVLRPGGPILRSQLRTFVRGTELVTVGQFPSGQGPPRPGVPGQRVDLGAGRSGELWYHPNHVALRAAMGAFQVVVMAPDPQLAEAVARTLRDDVSYGGQASAIATSSTVEPV